MSQVTATQSDEASRTIPKVSIASQYTDCTNSFNKLLECIEASNNQAIAQRLSNEFGRLRIWAGNSGAHRSGRVSLDHRLREASHLHEELTKLLGELHQDLEEALEVLEDGEGNESPQSLIVLGEEFIAEQGPLEDEEEEEELSELESLVSDIMHIITCLYKFSITIQNPAPKERLHKIAHIDVSYFEPWDIKHIEEKFRPVDPQNNFRVANYLSARLGQANTKRRQLLKYRQTHHNKIALYIDDPLPLKGAMERNESKLVTPNTEYGSFMAPEKIPGLEKASTVYTTSKSETTLSTVKIELLRPVEIQRDEDQLSQTSYATSINHTMRTWVPSPPNEITALQGEPFECPYCFTITKIRDRHDWKKHVFADLQPYVCTFLDCPREGELYGSQREWFDHEIQLHRRAWYCDTCSKSFSQKTLFQEHIKLKHSEVTQGHFEAIVSRCERVIVSDIVCPLCGTGLTFQTLEKHLGLHLQEIALFVLPRPGPGEGSNDRKSMKVGHLSQCSSEYLPKESSFDVDSDKEPNQPIIPLATIERISCICSYQHDDGFLVTCDNCEEFQHGVCMGINENKVPKVYECPACSPGAHHLEIEAAINIQEGFLKSESSKLELVDTPEGSPPPTPIKRRNTLTMNSAVNMMMRREAREEKDNDKSTSAMPVDGPSIERDDPTAPEIQGTTTTNKAVDAPSITPISEIRPGTSHSATPEVSPPPTPSKRMTMEKAMDLMMLRKARKEKENEIQTTTTSKAVDASSITTISEIRPGTSHSAATSIESVDDDQRSIAESTTGISPEARRLLARELAHERKLNKERKPFAPKLAKDEEEEKRDAQPERPPTSEVPPSPTLERRNTRDLMKLAIGRAKQKEVEANPPSPVGDSKNSKSLTMSNDAVNLLMLKKKAQEEKARKAEQAAAAAKPAPSAPSPAGVPEVTVPVFLPQTPATEVSPTSVTPIDGSATVSDDQATAVPIETQAEATAPTIDRRGTETPNTHPVTSPTPALPDLENPSVAKQSRAPSIYSVDQRPGTSGSTRRFGALFKKRTPSVYSKDIPDSPSPFNAPGSPFPTVGGTERSHSPVVSETHDDSKKAQSRAPSIYSVDQRPGTSGSTRRFSSLFRKRTPSVYSKDVPDSTAGDSSASRRFFDKLLGRKKSFQNLPGTETSNTRPGTSSTLALSDLENPNVANQSRAPSIYSVDQRPGTSGSTRRFGSLFKKRTPSVYSKDVPDSPSPFNAPGSPFPTVGGTDRSRPPVVSETHDDSKKAQSRTPSIYSVDQRPGTSGSTRRFGAFFKKRTPSVYSKDVPDSPSPFNAPGSPFPTVGGTERSHSPVVSETHDDSKKSKLSRRWDIAIGSKTKYPSGSTIPVATVPITSGAVPAPPPAASADKPKPKLASGAKTFMSFSKKK